MNFKVKVPGKVAGKVFVGAMWKLNGSNLEILHTHEDGNIVCEMENGNQETLNVNEFLKGSYIGDKYSDFDEEPEKPL